MDYSIQFTGQVNRIRMRKVRQAHIDFVRDRLANTEIWQRHLEFTMRDAVQFQERIASALGVDLAETTALPVVEGVAITLVAQELPSKFDKDAGARFSGTVSWRSIAVDSPSLSAAVYWRIKERFAERVLTHDDFGIFSNIDTYIQRQTLIPKIDPGSISSSAQSSPQCPSSPVVAASAAPLLRPSRLFQSLRSLQRMVSPR
jgi:hypothetical protein